MSSVKWQRAHPIVVEALAKPSDLRHAFVLGACGDDIPLRDEVLSLVAASERSPEAHDVPAAWLDLLGRHDVSRFDPGEEIARRYRVQRLLGRGGMGEVYEVLDKELDIAVALKTIYLATGSEDALQRLKLEGILARSVWHPNVCRVYDLGRHEDGDKSVWFLTMELLHGETLAERRQTVGRFPLDQVRTWTEQMAAGLGAAHRAGVVHRDFKTGNVMLVRKDGVERAIVTDFGTAQATRPAGEKSDHQGLIVGTPAYMAPEQLHGDPVGPWSDIYALGVVLYELVTGQLPFEGETAIAAGRKRLEEDVPPPRMIVPELDEQWEKVILRCLARRPEARYQRVEAVAEALLGHAPDDPGAAFSMPGAPLMEQRRTRHRLPAEHDRFVGREAELEELERSFAGGSRLVTLTGVGGMGKTRLAVRFGWTTRVAWPGGVWFCDLTASQGRNDIAASVAGTLGARLGHGDPIDQLSHIIAGRDRCLVILDNCEQITAHVSEAVSSWLERASEARFLVTSREKLGIAGHEIVQSIASLPIESGVDLFTARAQGLHPGLHLSDRELDTARDLVRLVDGMPLAIELAAARIRVMSISQIVAQMYKRFQLLTGGMSDRQQTLQATIDASWELLNPWERAAWSQCAVFDGGFTLDAAEAVLDVSEWSESPTIAEIVQSLADKSLLRIWISDDAPSRGPSSRPNDGPVARFGMYVSLQDYARVKLRENPVRIMDGTTGLEGITTERMAEDRHGKWYAQYGTSDAVTALDHSRGERRRKLERELGNIMAGCRRALERGNGGTAVTLYQACWAVLGLRGPLDIALELGDEVLKAPLRPREMASALRTLGHAVSYSARTDEARSHFERSLAIYREHGDRLQECAVLENLGALLRGQGRVQEARVRLEEALILSRAVGSRRAEGAILGILGNLDRDEGQMDDARTHYEEALAIHREVDNHRLEGVALSNLAILDYDQGRLEAAQAHFEVSLAIHREIGNRQSEGIVLGNLGSLNADRGRPKEALACFQAALAIHREVGHRRFEGVSLGDLGMLHRTMGEMEAARSYYEQALAIHREVGNRRLQGVCLGDLGDLHREQGRLDDAHVLLDQALAIHHEVGNRRHQGVDRARLGRLLQQEGRWEAAREALIDAEAIVREVGDPIELAKVLCARGEMEAAAGNRAGAQVAVGEAERIVEEIQSGSDSELGRLLARVRQQLTGTASNSRELQ